MGAKQSKRSVDISGKEAESGGEVAAAGGGAEGRVEALADVDALKPQVNGDAHIHENSEKEKQLDIGTPENEKDATTEKEEKKEQQNGNDTDKDATPATNGEPESKEGGDAAQTPEDGKKPKKEKVKKKWSLRSISFSRKDKPKQEKKQKEEEAKTNGEPDKVPEEAAEATPDPEKVEAAEEAKSETEVKEEKTPETPVTEPLTNGSSTPESKVETPAAEAAPAVAEPASQPELEPAPAHSEPEPPALNGLSLEEPKPEPASETKVEESAPEKPEPTVETEITPAPEIPVAKEVCVEKVSPESLPPPLPANPPPSSVVSFAASTMAPELDASLANTAEDAVAPHSIPNPATPQYDTPVSASLKGPNVLAHDNETEISCILKDTKEKTLVENLTHDSSLPLTENLSKDIKKTETVNEPNFEDTIKNLSKDIKETETVNEPNFEDTIKNLSKDIKETETVNEPNFEDMIKNLSKDIKETETVNKPNFEDTIKNLSKDIKETEILNEPNFEDTIKNLSKDIKETETLNEPIFEDTIKTVNENKTNEYVSKIHKTGNLDNIETECKMEGNVIHLNSLNNDSVVEKLIKVEVLNKIEDSNPELELAKDVGQITEKDEAKQREDELKKKLDNEAPVVMEAIESKQIELETQLLPEVVSNDWMHSEDMAVDYQDVSESNDDLPPPPPPLDADEFDQADINEVVDFSADVVPAPEAKTQILPEPIELKSSGEIEHVISVSEVKDKDLVQNGTCNGDSAAQNGELERPVLEDSAVAKLGDVLPAAPAPPQEPNAVSDKLAELMPEVPVIPELNTETLTETTTDVAVNN